MAKLFANKFNLDNLPDPVKVNQGDKIVNPHIRVEPVQPATTDTQKINKKLYDLGLQKGQMASADSILEKQGVRLSASKQAVSFVSVSRYGLTPVNQGSTEIVLPKYIDKKGSAIEISKVKKDMITDPKTVINKVQPGNRTIDPKTAIEKIKPGDRITNPDTVIKEVKPGARTVDPNTAIDKVKPGSRTFDPNTVIKKIEPGDRTVDPHTTINKIKPGDRIVNPKTKTIQVPPKKDPYLIDIHKGTGFINYGAEGNGNAMNLPKNWSGGGSTIPFPSTISLKNRLKQADLGTTKHLAEFILSDYNTGYIKIVRADEPQPKISPVQVQKVIPGERTYNPNTIINPVKPGDRIVNPNTIINVVKPGDRITDPNTKPNKIKPGDRIIDPKTEIIKIKPGDRIINPKIAITKVVADELIVNPKIKVSKVAPGSRTTDPNTVIKIVKPGARTTDPKLKITPVAIGDRTFNPNTHINVVQPGDRTTDPQLVINPVTPGSRTVDPQLVINPVVPGARTHDPKTKVKFVKGTKVTNPRTVINRVRPGSRTFDPRTVVNRVAPGDRTVDPRTRVIYVLPGERTFIPNVRLYLFPQVDDKIYYTQEPGPFLSDTEIYQSAVTTDIFTTPDFQTLGYFVSDVNLNSSLTSDTLSTDTSPLYAARVPQVNGGTYSSQYNDKQPYVQPNSSTLLNSSPLQTAGIEAKDRVSYTHDSWNAGGAVQETKITEFPNAQWADPNLPGGYRALNYGEIQKRIVNNPNKNLDFTYTEATNGQSPGSGLRPYRERLGMPETGADTLNTAVGKTGNDFVGIKFESTRDNITLQFRSFLKNFTDSFSPLYTDVNYVGRPDTLKVFKGTTRQMGLAFTVPVFSEDELKVLYQKLEKLVKIGTMGKATGASYMQGPFLKLTVGGWCHKTPIILGSLKYETQPTEYTWDIKNEVPHIVDVSMDCIALSANNGKTFFENNTYIQYGQI